MRDDGASVEPSAAGSGSNFPVPSAETVGAAWTDRSSDGVAPRPDKAKAVAAGMLFLGAVLLLFLPLGGALFLVTGGLGLAIASEAPTDPLTAEPSLTIEAATAPHPQTPVTDL